MQKGEKRSAKNQKRNKTKRSHAKFLSKLLLKYGTETDPETGIVEETGFVINSSHAKTKWGGNKFAELHDWHMEKKKKREEEKKALLMTKVGVE
jgi:hypothetical protein